MTVATRSAGSRGKRPARRPLAAGMLIAGYQSLQHSSRRLGRRSLALAGASLLFFFGPAFAYTVGVRAQPIENRPLAAFPSPRSGWTFFAGVERWGVDNLPLRDLAVRGNTALTEDLFGETPDYGARGAAAERPGGVPGIGAPQAAGGGGRAAGQLVVGAAGDDEDGPSTGPSGQAYPRVVQGSDGWLYHGDDARLACEPEVDLDSIVAGWRRLVSVVQSSGRRVIVTVAPDKSTVVPSYLPANFLGKRCMAEHKAALWARLARGDLGPQYLDLRGPIERQQRTDGAPLYWSGDSHWLPLGELLFAREVVRRLQPSLVQGDLTRSADVENPGPEESEVDLPTLLGSSRTEIAAGWRVRRDGVSTAPRTQKASVAVGRHLSTSTGPGLVGAPTVLMGDSFSYHSIAQLTPYFADITLVHRKRATPEEKISAIRSADVVVLEVVERHFASSTSSLVDPGFLDSLEQALRAAPR